MTQRQVVPTFTSPTSILAWAGAQQGHRFGDAWYVLKNGLYYYFAKYPNGEYKLIMTSEKDLGD